jgi:hypothetical protein
MSEREPNRMKTQEKVKQAPTTTTADASIVEPIDPLKKGDTLMKTRSTRIIIGVYILLAVLGIGTGYLLSRATITGVSGITGIASTNKVVGSADTTTFKDSAIGVIQKNGTDGEGTHSLIRDGGPSQTVTLMSSVVDLDQYVGKKVKVFGQTMAAQKAAWLMDVGRIELQ